MKFTEKHLVEDYIVQQLKDNGWKCVPADELERESLEEPILIPNLIRAVQRINKELEVGDEEINNVLNELKLTISGIEGSKRILNFYRFGVPVKFEKERIVKFIQLFDFENVDNNEFLVSRQVHCRGKDKIIPDIVLYVNGIPLVDIECKNPTEPGVSWFDAYKQIKDYENTVPELYKYVQIGIAAESQARYFPITPWLDDVEIYEWREEAKDSLDSTIQMFSKFRLLDLVKNFLFFRVEFGRATKVIARYMQYRAANKIVNRVTNYLHNEEKKNRGLIWHWQGSGKTLTMIFTAHKLFYAKELENPSIFLIVDRIELEDQLYKEFNFLDILKPEIIGSIPDLKKILRYDDYRGKRGVFVILIHKFRYGELFSLQKDLEEVSERKETIMNRKNIVAFVDEGHRTQYGILATQMKSILKSAFFFAFTGTPISKMDRDTYLQFSFPPEELYLDRYFIVDALRDKFTVKIVYHQRLENEVHLEKSKLDTFLKGELQEITEEIRGEVEEKIKDRLNIINVHLEDITRIKMISEDIAKHFKENVDGKFKSVVVAASRTACVRYKRELDKLLPEEYSEIVMSADVDREDKEIVRGYVKETRARFGGKEFEDVRKDVIDRFLEEEHPKILIVTEMLLTGFNAPILQVMYLDKPLKEHRLLQAVARTNRPYKDLKEAGVVIDYVGILKEYNRALEMYSTEDIEKALLNYDNLRDEFIEKINDIQGLFDELTQKYDRETLLKAIEILTADERKEEEFVDNFRELRKLFELLGPDEVKLSHFETYKWISAVYTFYMKMVIQQPGLDAYITKYFDKTVKFVHQTTEIEELEKSLPAITFDENFLKRLEEQVKSTKEKAANILFTLHRFILVERHKSPVYESLSDRVEKLLKLWREKTKDYEKIYLDGAKTFEEANAMFLRQKNLEFSNLEYALLLTLEKEFGKDEFLIEEIKKLSTEIQKNMFPGWIVQTTIKKEIGREVRRFVRRFKRKHNLTFGQMENLYNILIESVENYGS